MENLRPEINECEGILSRSGVPNLALKVSPKGKSRENKIPIQIRWLCWPLLLDQAYLGS